jgi:hypothetical protein
MNEELEVLKELRNTIQESTSLLKNGILNMDIKNENLIEALEKNTRAHNISTLITLCEISVKRPYYNIFSTEEVMNIYINLKEEFREMGKARTNGEKNKVKRIK